MGLGDKLHDTAEKVSSKFSNMTNIGNSDTTTDHKIKSGNDGSYEIHKPYTSNEVEQEYNKGHAVRGNTAEFVDNVDKKGGHTLGRQTLSGTDKGLGSKVLHKQQPDPPTRHDIRKDVPREAFMKGETTIGDTYGLNSRGQRVSGLDESALAGGDIDTSKATSGGNKSYTVKSTSVGKEHLPISDEHITGTPRDDINKNTSYSHHTTSTNIGGYNPNIPTSNLDSQPRSTLGTGTGGPTTADKTEYKRTQLESEQVAQGLNRGYSDPSATYNTH